MPSTDAMTASPPSHDTVTDTVFGDVKAEAPAVAEPTPRRNFWAGIATYQAGSDELAITSQEMLAKGGLDWDVEVRPTFRAAPDGSMIQAECYAVCKKSPDAQIGTVRSRYSPYQNREIFAFGDKIVEGGKGHWVATLEQRHGARVAMVMQLDEEFNVLGNDAHRMYLVFRSSHDGSSSLRVDLSPIRMDCFNQNALISRTTEGTFKAIHVGDLDAKQAQSVLLGATAYTDRYKEIAEQLAATEVTIKEARSLISGVMLDRARKDEIAAEIDANWRTSPTIPNELRNTGWGLLNATTEYFGHQIRRQGNGNSLFESEMEGEGARVRNRLATKLLRRTS